MQVWSPNSHDLFTAILLCCSVSQSYLTLYNPIDCSMPGFLVLHCLSEFRFMSIESVMSSNHHITCHPLLLLSSIVPSIRVLSNVLSLSIRWPKYWSFSFSISSSNEYFGLISFRVFWFDLLAVQRTLQSLFGLGWKKIKMKSLLVDSVLFSIVQIRTSLSSQFITNF